MAYSAIPQFLRGADPSLVNLWRDRRITDLHTLRSHCQSSICLALDVEGSDGHGGGITSVGVALVWDFLGRLQQTNTSADLARMVREYGVEGHNIACGSRRKNHGKYERSPLAKIHQVQRGDVEERLNNILESAKSAAFANAEPEKLRATGSQSFIMAVWNGYSEFQAISSTFSSVARDISHWVDLSDIVAGMSVSALDRRQFSLRDVMLSLGFGAEHTQKLSGGHSAGMDAVRTVGVLLELCSKSADDQLVIRRYGAEERRHRKLWESRPRPPESFPFTTKVTTAEGLMPSTDGRRSMSSMLQKEAQVTMDRFVEEWNGRQVEDKILQVTGLLPPDGTIIE
ncbi:hypothetical protein F5X99DRAFT_410843 [Biscogniauxia marginata]|nr:hypothetical protein F5X99DRAFT_410843 [Biscogniauxia marginata]